MTCHILSHPSTSFTKPKGVINTQEAKNLVDELVADFIDLALPLLPEELDVGKIESKVSLLRQHSEPDEESLELIELIHEGVDSLQE